jgi:acyl carrier protein
LGEIETVLSEHPGVREVVVVVRENDAHEKRLVAYVVAEDSYSPNAGELRRHAQRHLPEYMLPAAFVPLNEMPLTATGKIDRRALPDPDQQRPDLITAFAGPRTPFEEKLCEIWTDLLRIDRIGVHDNFFELGGHSLLATQLVSRIREAFQVDLPLQVLFEFPTINELTKAIASARAAQEDTSEVAELLEHLKQLSPDDVKLMLNADPQ